MIRHAHPADVPAIVAAYDWLFAPPGIRPSDWSPAIATDRLRAAIADDRAAILVADDNHAVVGFATIYLDIVSVRFGQRAWVEDLAVAPRPPLQRDRKGFARCGKAWARDHGAVWLGLESGSARLDAHRFYEREGPDGWSRSFRWTL
jgi:hypothetical protein